jgi:hypothetical protein
VAKIVLSRHKINGRHSMGIVISFPNPKNEIGSEPEPAAAKRSAAVVERPFDVSALALKIISIQDKAKLDLDVVIASFGIALMHGRRLRDLITDPEGQRRIEENIGLIEAMLEVARLKVASL